MNVEDLFTPKKKELEDLALKYKDLRKWEIKNKEELKIVHNAEQELIKTRTAISKARLDYTRPIEQAKKEAIAKEKELLWVIWPVEEDLKERKKAYLDEQERIKKEKEEQVRKKLQERIDELNKFNYSYSDVYKLSQMSDEDFNVILDQVKIDFENEEKVRKEKEEQEKIENKKNAIKTMILNAKSFDDLLSAENFAKDHKIDFLDFQEEFWKKKEMIEFEAKKKREQDEMRKKELNLEIREKILNATTIVEIVHIESDIVENELLNIEDYKNELDKKTDSIKKALDEELKRRKEKEDEEKERIEKEAKEKAEKELEERRENTKKEIKRINENVNESYLMSLSDWLEKFYYVNIDFDEVQEALQNRIWVLNKARVEKEEQEKLEKQKKYKEFLKKNWVTQEQIEAWEYTISKNEDLKTITIFKKIDVFKY